MQMSPKPPLPSGMPSSRSGQFAMHLWMIANPQPCLQLSHPDRPTLWPYLHRAVFSSDLLEVFMEEARDRGVSDWYFFFKFENYLSRGTGFRTDGFKVTLGKVEVRFYLQVFKSDPVLTRGPGLLSQIILVNQIKSANHPGKGSY